MAHRYKITVQPMREDGMAADQAALTFEVTNHDDLLAIVSRTGTLDAVPAAEVAEFAIGLKLFTEVLLRHRKDPLFEALWPHVGAFMKRLKSLQPIAR